MADGKVAQPGVEGGVTRRRGGTVAGGKPGGGGVLPGGQWGKQAAVRSLSAGVAELNTMPSLDLNEPINWDEIDDFEGNVHDLDYDYVWESGNEGDGNTTDEEDEIVPEDVLVEPEAGGDAHTVQQVEEASMHHVEEADAVPQADAGDEAVFVAFDSGTPANIKRRRYYPPDIKRIFFRFQ
nr:unnamed protein product [Digitaria exilis]